MLMITLCVHFLIECTDNGVPNCDICTSVDAGCTQCEANYGFFDKDTCTSMDLNINVLLYYHIRNTLTSPSTTPYRPISRVVIGREVDYRSRLIYVRYCLTNTTLCL